MVDLLGDNPFTQLARDNWLDTRKPVTRVQPEVVKNEIYSVLEKENFSSLSIQLLESLQILELYLWPGFSDGASNYHVILIALIINAKHKEGLPSWSLLVDRPDEFSLYFRRLITLLLDAGLGARVRTSLLTAVTNAFQSLDNPLLRKECAPLVAITIWHNLAGDRLRDKILEDKPQFKKAWRAATKRHDAADETAKRRLHLDRSWLYSLLLDFLDILYSPARHGDQDLVYCERFMEFLSDLQSQFPTRRYVNTLLQDLNILVAVKSSPFFQDQGSALLRDFYNLLRHYTSFPIDDQTGQQESLQTYHDAHFARLANLQRVALKHYKEKLTLLALSNYGALEKPLELKNHLDTLDDQELITLAALLDLRTEYPKSNSLRPSRAFITETIIFVHQKQPGFQDVVRNMSLLPTESSLYEPSLLRNEVYDGRRALAIPKLNLQYLTTGDFLWRSFILYRCEAFYEIRKDMEDTIKRLQPRIDSSGQLRLEGSSRMALQIGKPAIVEVIPARVGEVVPAQVRAEIIIDVTRLNDAARVEWESLRVDDVVFLLSVKPADNSRRLTNGHDTDSDTSPFEYLRSAEVLQVLDDNGRPLRLNNNKADNHQRRPRQLRLLVKLDPNARHQDLLNIKAGKPDILDSINLVVRRRSRENNFKPILSSIRQLILAGITLPSWLQDVFLGLGDPTAASYKDLPQALKSLDYRDTFIDWHHLQSSFPETNVIAENDQVTRSGPPYIITSVSDGGIAKDGNAAKRRKHNESKHDSATVTGSQQGLENVESHAVPTNGFAKPTKKRRREEPEEILKANTLNVVTYQPTNQGPYPSDIPKLNKIPFTPAQITAITAGTQPGLTVVVGPPGTGKTDTITQIINNIYHNFPSERTLLIAHSNQALNQLFQKIVALDIDERHLLRLGRGEGDLHRDSDTSFGKHGRVESFLELGARFLAEVDRLAQSFDAPGAHGSSCETADYFNSVYIKPAWSQFWATTEAESSDIGTIIEAFPFYTYFSTAPQPLFPPDASMAAVLDIARGCHKHIQKLFSELEDIRPFEILRNDREKQNYLLVKEARIIAMTSTYAAMRRQEIADLGFRYDNVVMEEAAQITEVENFIPLTLQDPIEGELPLKRVVLCGDHLQNSPVVQNLAFRQYANLEQSLFLRLIRLGVPVIMLDKQGRARASLAELYKWRYNGLGNLPVVSAAPEYLTANAGLRYDYQFIDVPDYKGRGEGEPTPHFVQNLGEAEYAVALFMYMRLLGYPAASISILTAYAGQRALIRDVLQHRCARHRLFGLPRALTTVDQYQGEQNDCKSDRGLRHAGPPTNRRSSCDAEPGTNSSLFRHHPLPRAHGAPGLPARPAAPDGGAVARPPRAVRAGAARARRGVSRAAARARTAAARAPGQAEAHCRRDVSDGARGRRRAAGRRGRHGRRRASRPLRVRDDAGKGRGAARRRGGAAGQRRRGRGGGHARRRRRRRRRRRARRRRAAGRRRRRRRGLERGARPTPAPRRHGDIAQNTSHRAMMNDGPRQPAAPRHTAPVRQSGRARSHERRTQRSFTSLRAPHSWAAEEAGPRRRVASSRSHPVPCDDEMPALPCPALPRSCRVAPSLAWPGLAMAVPSARGCSGSHSRTSPPRRCYCV